MKIIKRCTSWPLVGLLVFFFGCNVSEISNTESGNTAGTLSPAAGTSPIGTTTTEYEIIDLGTLGGNISEALAINELGQVVGFGTTVSGEIRAFLWSQSGDMQDLGTLGGDVSVAHGINELGQVVGYSRTASGEAHAFLWDEFGGMRDLGTLGGDESRASGINDRGQVVGQSRTTSGPIHAFLWDESGDMQDLGTLGGTSSQASGINDWGQVVGQSTTASGETHAFLWDETEGMQDLGTLGGTSGANAINDRALVVGSSIAVIDGGSAFRAFLWDESGGMQDLGTLGGTSSFALGINEQGQVVGSSEKTLDDAGFVPNHAFLWDETEGMRDLGTFGRNISRALGINEQGQVVGASSTVSGETHAALWNPVVNMPPVADTGLDQSLECAGASTAVTLNGSASGDPDGDDLTYSWSLNGAEIAAGVSPQIELEEGSYVLTLTVTDPAGESSTDEVVINIVDTQAPVISYSVETGNLWPPNHKMHLAVAGISASDVCNPDPSVSVVVASNEPANGRGDGNTDEDWQVEDNGDGSYEVYLRAERSGRGSGRVYTVTITAEDASGNVSQEIVEVNVAHDQGRKAKM